MKLADLWTDKDRRDALIKALDTTRCFLWQVAHNWRGKRAGESFAMDIEKFSGETGEPVRCETLRPDVEWIRDADGKVIGHAPADRRKPTERRRKPADRRKAA